MLCTPCPWNTTCPCGVQQMTGPTCVVPPAWVSLPLSLSLFLSPSVPDVFQPRSSSVCYPRLAPSVSPAMAIRVVPPCLDTGMDLTGIFSPPDIRLPTKIGEKKEERKKERGRKRDWWSRATRRRSRGPSRDTAARITRATSLIFLLPGSPRWVMGVVMSGLVRGSVG